jgi:hypothetical protein
MLLDFIDSTRRRLALRFWTEGVLRAGEGLMWLLLLALLVWTLGAPAWLLRTLFWLPLLLCLAWLTARFFVQPRRFYASPRSVAVFLEHRLPELRDQLISATEFATLETAPSTFSATLTDAVVAQVSERTRELSRKDLVPFGRLKMQAARSGVVLLLAVVLFAVFPDHMRQAGASLLGFSNDRNGADLRVLAGDIELIYRYPAYTGLAALTVPNSSGDIEAYPGTVVGISVRAVEDVEQAELRLEDGPTIELQPDGRGLFAGELVVPAEKTTYVFAFDGDRDGRKRDISIIPDRLPQITLDYPPDELDVRETDRIDMAFRVEDDFGLGELTLVVDFATAEGRNTARIPVHQFGDLTRRYNDTWLWDLATMTLRPGDRVTYFLEATDNDSVQGPKTGRSETHTLKVFSVYEHHDKLIARQEEIWEAMISLLGKYLEQDISDKTLPSVEDVMTTYGNTVTELDESIVKPLAVLVPELEEDSLANDAVREMIRAMQADLSAHLEEYKVQLAQFDEYGPQRTDLTFSVWRLKSLRGISVQKLERYIMDLYDLLKKEKYDALVNEGEKLSELRDEIRRLMEEYKQTGDEALKRRITDLLKEFRRRLGEMMAKMSKISKELPEEFINQEAMNSEALTQNLDSLEKMLEEGNLDEALAQLENMSLQLNEMMQGMKEGSEQLGESLYSESMQKLMNLQKDLDQMLAKERDLHKQTQEKYDAYRKLAEEQFKRNLESRMKDLMAKVREASENLKAIESNRDGNLERYLDSSLTRLNDLIKGLQAQDINGALEAARVSKGTIESVLSLLAGYWAGANERQRREGLKRGQTARSRVEEVIEALEQIMPDPSKMMSQQDLQQMQQMARRQQRLVQEAQGMRQQMQQMMDDMPFMPADSGQQMDQATQSMSQSGGQLQQNQPGRAEGHQQQAIQSLQQISQGLQQAMQQMQGSMQPGGMQPGMRRQGPGRRMSKEDVTLPQAGEQKAPAELRQDILDAMKRKAPESYKPQTDQYYKELVK